MADGSTLRGAVVAIVLLSTARITAGQFEESLVALSAHLQVRALNYSSAEPDTTVVFSDLARDPVGIEIGIGNNTDETLEVGTSDRSWVASLSYQTFVRRGSLREDISREMRSPVQTPSGQNALAMQARRALTFRGVVARADGEPLAPGQYELRIALSESALSPSARALNNILTRTIRFEVREPTSNEETADAYLQRSYQARLAGRPAESREWAQRVLALNSASIAALTDVASAWLDGEENCTQAVPLYRQALVLLSTGADPLLRISDHGREDWASALRGKLAARCGIR